MHFLAIGAGGMREKTFDECSESLLPAFAGVVLRTLHAALAHLLGKRFAHLLDCSHQSCQIILPRCISLLNVRAAVGAALSPGGLVVPKIVERLRERIVIRDKGATVRPLDLASQHRTVAMGDDRCF